MAPEVEPGVTVPDFINDNIEALPPEIQGEPMLPSEDLIPQGDSPMLEDLDDLPSEDELLRAPGDSSEGEPRSGNHPLQPPPVLKQGLRVLEAMQAKSPRVEGGGEKSVVGQAESNDHPKRPVPVATRPKVRMLRKGAHQGWKGSPKEPSSPKEAKTPKRFPPVRVEGEPVPLPEVTPETSSSETMIQKGPLFNVVDPAIEASFSVKKAPLPPSVDRERDSAVSADGVVRPVEHRTPLPPPPPPTR
jgi:hypothetical protein